MILVTGGTGLLGSHLLFELTGKGKPVRALVRDKSATSHVEKLFQLLGDTTRNRYSLIEWAEGDILDIFAIDAAMAGVDEVYHCAALIGFNRSDHDLMMQINCGGTANMVNACLRHGIRKLVYASSVAVLGDPEKGNMTDEEAHWKTSQKNSGYAISKYSAEREVWRGIEEGLNAVIVNPSVILGISCRDRASNRVFINMERLSFLYPGGTTGYVDVRDVAATMIILMESNVSAERFLISNENLSYKDFMSLGAEILHKRKPFIRVGRFALSIFCNLNAAFSFITRTKPLFTPEVTRPLTKEIYYSSEKFRNAFNYSFIPVKQSLADGFRLLRMLSEKETR